MSSQRKLFKNCHNVLVRFTGTQISNFWETVSILANFVLGMSSILTNSKPTCQRVLKTNCVQVATCQIITRIASGNLIISAPFMKLQRNCPRQKTPTKSSLRNPSATLHRKKFAFVKIFAGNWADESWVRLVKTSLVSHHFAKGLPGVKPNANSVFMPDFERKTASFRNPADFA